MMNGWIKYVPVKAGRIGRITSRRDPGGGQDNAADRFARHVFKLLDLDEDGAISAEEWQKSVRTRPSFERRGIELELPADIESFVEVLPRR